MESDEDWFPGKFLDDGFCELYALVIWKTFDESECEIVNPNFVVSM